MSFTLTSLPHIPHDSPSHFSKKLPDFHPLFFVPPLEDRPQNPIVDALIEVSTPPDLDVLYGGYRDDVEVNDHGEERDEQDLWTREVEQTQRKNQNLSWDTLRTTFPTQSTPTPFLSEQSNDAFDAARHHVLPKLNDPSLRLRYILPTELLELLMINMAGNSSPLYVWDEEHERFVSHGAREGTRLAVIIEGLDEVASDSIIKRFLTIGMLMRRMETLVISYQRRDSNSTVHAFSHALSTVLVHVRSALTAESPYPAARLTSLWLHYAETESSLSALAALCGQKANERPPYEQLPESPAALLSHIYKHLQRHIEHRSPRAITAIVAYILTAASRDYFTEIGESLGIHDPSRPPWLRTAKFSKRDRNHGSGLLQLDDLDLDQSGESFVSDTDDDHELPEFFPSELVAALPAARKSLRIIEAADPAHPLCSTPAVATCEWVWSSEEVERLWMGQEKHDRSGDSSGELHFQPMVTAAAPRNYKIELQQFQLFDLEPGAHLPNPSSSVMSGSPCNPLESFLSAFPERLPPLSPTLQHLAVIVLQPFITRATLLTSSLLRLYLTSLHFSEHVTLLRSYMLITLPSFRTRLVEALFSDSDEYRSGTRGVRARVRARLGIPDARDTADAAADDGHSAGQGIGLGHGLAERGTWPPGGADLSFSLRTVIVDSLDERTAEGAIEETENVWKEAEVRIGFAIRDLPIGDGRERWLNSMSIEALDFLYLDYKPPHPLDVVITTEVLSKYQRIFTFLLRLFRAETVARLAFRSSFKTLGPVFEYAPKAQQILVRLRFQIQNFVASFMAYTFDSAIGSNFDAYIRRISKLREDALAGNIAADGHEILDVFALQASHSDLLNDILSGCLLRTAQRSAGEILRDLFELVLQFGALLTDTRRGRLREANAVEELRTLDALFQKQMLSFIKTIQTLQMKDRVSTDSANALQELGSILGKNSLNAEPYSPFEDLLIRIDSTGWWRRKLERQNRRLL